MTLRLVWPRWRGAGTSSVGELAPEFPFDVARRGYAVGSAALAAVLPPHDGPTAVVPVAMAPGDRTGPALRAQLRGSGRQTAGFDDHFPEVAPSALEDRDRVADVLE